MQGKQLRKLESELWRAADQLRAKSKLTASKCVETDIFAPDVF
jgi:type I restriction enzyme M protein